MDRILRRHHQPFRILFPPRRPGQNVLTVSSRPDLTGYPARTDNHFRRLLTVIREYLDALEAGRFSYRPGFGCGMCEFRESNWQSWRP